MERVTSYQMGAETTALKHVWVKLSTFRHELRDAIDRATFLNSEHQRRQGVELEMKTTPIYRTSLTAGAEYISAKDLNTGLTILNIPKHTYDLGLVYDDEQSFRASLKGRYIDWNADPAYQGSYGRFVFDLNASATIYKKSSASLDVFMTLHNIFNSSQYVASIYENPSRWFEAGARYKF
jgi:vitamin B12 transporter